MTKEQVGYIVDTLRAIIHRFGMKG
jgi:hypothetical protein